MNSKTKRDGRSYQPSRRDILRVGAAATAGSAGLSLGTERAQAIVPLVPVALGAAAGVGVAALDAIHCRGPYAVMTGCDTTAEDVSQTASEQDVFSDFSAAVTAYRGYQKQHGDRAGVVHDGTVPTAVGDQHDFPNDNDVAHNLVEHAMGEAALTWADGGTIGDAQFAAAEALDLQAGIAIWNRVAKWNDVIAAVTPSMDEAFYGGNPLSVTTNVGDIYGESTGGSTVFPAPSKISPSIRMYGSSGPDDQGVVSERDISDQLPISVSDLPEDDQPDSGRFSILEVPVPNDWSEEQSLVITPLWQRYSGNPTITSEYHEYYSDTNNPDDDCKYSPATIRAIYDNSEIQIRTYRWIEQIEAVESIRQQVKSNLETNVENVYNKLSTGTIAVDDVLSGRMLYQQAEVPSGQARTVTETMMIAGMSPPDSATQVTIKNEDGDNVSGILSLDLADGVDKITIEGSGTISSSDYDAGYLVPSDSTGSAFEIQDSSNDIEVVEVLSGDKITWTRRDGFVANETDSTKLTNRVEENKERYDELQQMIQELDDGSGFGAGNRASGGLIGLAVAAVGGYLVFGGGS